VPHSIKLNSWYAPFWFNYYKEYGRTFETNRIDFTQLGFQLFITTAIFAYILYEIYMSKSAIVIKLLMKWYETNKIDVLHKKIVDETIEYLTVKNGTEIEEEKSNLRNKGLL
jgi:hypothetical protein